MSTISKVEYLALLERLRRRVVALLLPANLRNDRYYQQQLRSRTSPGKKPYLEFGEILKCYSINDFGVIDAPQYYNLLEKAVKAATRTIPNINVWRAYGYNRIYFN